MIRAYLKNGRVWDWEPTDRISVGGQSLRLDELARLELDGMQVGGGDRMVGSVEQRYLVLTDPETGIQVVAVWTREGAVDVGTKLSADRLVVATQMPRLTE